ncbi:MAG TPA: CAP domain-containing protein [Pseudonocardia sp.]
MTTHGKRRRFTPVLIGLVTVLLVAAVVLIIGPLRHSSDTAVPSSDTAAAGPTAESPSPVERLAPADPSAAASAPPAPLAISPSIAPSTPPTPAPDRPGAPVALPLFVPGMPPYLPALLPVIPKPAPAKPVIPKPATPKTTPTPGLGGPAAQVVALTNAQRVKAGCKPLKVDSRLNLSAQRHSADMARRNYFEHEDPEGHDFADREKAARFTGDSGGENIAMGQTSAAEVMNDWMNSPGHRRNILDCSFTLIGIGYVANGHYWTQNFGG